MAMRWRWPPDSLTLQPLSSARRGGGMPFGDVALNACPR
jgi:hypothetical protein